MRYVIAKRGVGLWDPRLPNRAWPEPWGSNGVVPYNTGLSGVGLWDPRLPNRPWPEPWGSSGTTPYTDGLSGLGGPRPIGAGHSVDGVPIRPPSAEMTASVVTAIQNQTPAQYVKYSHVIVDTGAGAASQDTVYAVMLTGRSNRMAAAVPVRAVVNALPGAVPGGAEMKDLIIQDYNAQVTPSRQLEYQKRKVHDAKEQREADRVDQAHQQYMEQMAPAPWNPIDFTAAALRDTTVGRTADTVGTVIKVAAVVLPIFGALVLWGMYRRRQQQHPDTPALEQLADISGEAGERALAKAGQVTGAAATAVVGAAGSVAGQAAGWAKEQLTRERQWSRATPNP